MNEPSDPNIISKSRLNFDRKWLFTLIAIAAAIGVIAIAAIKLFPASTKTTTKEPPRTILKGVSFSPKSFSQQDFTSFFSKATQAGTVISWAGLGDELSKPGSAPVVIASLRSQYQFEPIMIFNNPAPNDIKAFAKAYHPHYLGIGNEVNPSFAPTFNSLYNAIKSVSPNTKIFTTFQLEKTKGLNGGLFGGKNDPRADKWQDLEAFQKADFFAFTTYPGLIYKNPSDIPKDYYSEIAQHTSKDIAFSEIGWFRTGPTGWDSSEEEQAAFIHRFFADTESLHPLFRIWSFLYDPEAHGPFNTMGLLKITEETSPAWDEWLKH